MQPRMLGVTRIEISKKRKRMFDGEILRPGVSASTSDHIRCVFVLSFVGPKYLSLPVEPAGGHFFSLHVDESKWNVRKI